MCTLAMLHAMLHMKYGTQRSLQAPATSSTLNEAGRRPSEGVHISTSSFQQLPNAPCA